MTRDVWCPFAERDLVRTGAGPFVNAPAKIVHHTTEGSSYAGARGAYEKSGSLPHFTDSFELGIYRVWQHWPTDQAATALQHPKGRPETNRANCIQIEHVGFAAHAYQFADAYLLGIATLCRWIEATCGVPRSAPFKFGAGAPRLSWEQWATFAGHFGHCHVPGNDHWDPGALVIAAVLSAGIPSEAGPVAPQPVPAPTVAFRGFLEGKPVALVMVSIPTDANGDGGAPAPPRFLSVSAAGSHDKYDPNIPEDKRDKDSIVVPIGARPSGTNPDGSQAFRIVVAKGPANTTVGAPVLVAD